jgi:hypothetical protein
MSLQDAVKPKRGRPVKAPPKVRRLLHSVSEYCAASGLSRATAFRRMRTGALKYLQPSGKNAPRQIPTSEYVRLGIIQNIDELG